MANKQAQIPGGAFFGDVAEATLYQRQVPGSQFVNETQQSTQAAVSAAPAAIRCIYVMP